VSERGHEWVAAFRRWVSGVDRLGEHGRGIEPLVYFAYRLAFRAGWRAAKRAQR